MQRPQRLAAVIAGLAVAVTGLAATQDATAASPRPAAVSRAAVPARAWTPPPLAWGECGNRTLRGLGAECADLVVPLDYADPAGPTITLAVSRLRHSSPDADYQGVMLVNPGGPGASGLIYAALGEGASFPGDGDTTYDWIGFDPRGVGSSRPVLTCDGDHFGYDRPNYRPHTALLKQVWLDRSAAYADACRDSNASSLLTHARTITTVRDMESLRKALGQTTIGYYGFSYGTYLGQVYASRHPSRVGRFVLDANVDPRRVWYAANLDQDRAFQTVIDLFFGYLADHEDVFGLGATQQEVARRVLPRATTAGRHTRRRRGSDPTS